ncbi:DUF885 family protein [Pelosinus sp. sgz500959]|uniref:DUF885 family protein n=1 Tax=Pelosinus sp. sgz500959 TaxID=3242472 RepID=UPI00366B17D9
MIEYNELIQKFHDYFTRDANACVSLGVNRHLDDLPDPSIEGIQFTIEEGKKLLAELRSFPRGILEFDEMLDLDLAILQVEFEIYSHSYTFNERIQLQQKPTAGDDISDGLFLMFINDPRSSIERLDNMTARLEKVPQYLEKLLKRLDVPVQRWVDMDIEKITGLPELFDTIYNWGQEENYSQLDRLAVAKEEAEVALVSYRTKLQAMPTTNHLFIGKEQAAKLIKLRGIEQSIDDLHEMATEFLNDVSREIEELRLKIVNKYQLPQNSSVEDVQNFLNKKYKIKLENTGTLSDVITRYTLERDKISHYLQERDLFPIFAEQSMLIIQTPSFMAPSIPAGAMVSPPPFRAGIKKSIVYLTLSEELLDEHTELSIPSMMIHEGIPGHHLQLSTACNQPSVVRRHCNAMEHAEGWTTMLEDYMLDIGYMDQLADEARFIAKRDISRIGARVAIDLYFMTGEKKYLDVGIDVDLSSTDPFVNAGKLLEKVTGFVAGRVEAELNWYSQERGYPLSYLTGNKLVWALKNDLIKAQKGRLEGIEFDKVFHKVYLESGNMPLTFLRRVFEHKQMLS